MDLTLLDSQMNTIICSENDGTCSLKKSCIVSLQVALQRSSGGKEPGAGRVVAVSVDRRRVLLMVHLHVLHSVLLVKKD